MSSGDELKLHPPEGHVNGTTHNARLEEIEAAHIKKVLQQTGWRIKGDGGAAHILGLNPSTLYSRMKKLGISIPHPEKDDIST
jgi:transcriptional regulator with GAF, ATPase, and Fis domain